MNTFRPLSYSTFKSKITKEYPLLCKQQFEGTTGYLNETSSTVLFLDLIPTDAQDTWEGALLDIPFIGGISPFTRRDQAGTNGSAQICAQCDL
jgi:hypothetical protein